MITAECILTGYWMGYRIIGNTGILSFCWNKTLKTKHVKEKSEEYLAKNVPVVVRELIAEKCVKKLLTCT